MEEGGGIMAALDGGSTARRDENLLDSKHSIFLSHSGAQKCFVDQLCLDIERHDRYPFFDQRRNSLSIGCNFPDLIFKAIKQCQVAVVVLSEDFFSRSKWPMVELAALVKRKSDDQKLVIMPVFLGLTHAQCRDEVNQARWMRVWQDWAKADSRIDLREWQAVLKVFGYTNGICLNDVLDEVKCRGEIVEAICKEVPSRTRWDDSHVQGRSRLCMALRAKIDGMQVSKSYGSRILGIYGVGGIGKTTACKVLCNDYFEEFEGKVCHVEFGIGSKLLMLQEMLKRLTETNEELIKNFCEDECKDRLRKDLKKKVFLAIDNVSDRQQIVGEAKDLLRMGFMEGSIVIVTARASGQLGNLNLEECMEMPELDEDDARSLFLYHAAPGSYLKNADEMEEQVVNRCIKRCYFGKGDGISHHYHPLALKVLGGQLGNDPKEWIEKLNELEGLKSKSLLESLGDGSRGIGMHDLWREFAIMKSKGGEFRSGPWLYEKIYAPSDSRREEPILSTGGGSEGLRSMCMVGDGMVGRLLKEIDLSLNSNLKVLKLVNVIMDTEVLDVSSLRQLKSLEIVFCISVPELDIVGLGCLRNLVFLFLGGMKITTSAHEEIGGLTNLQVLHVRKVYSSSILPNFSRLKLLRDVCFHSRAKGESCVISGLSANMTNLRRLNLSMCSSLRSCDGVGDLVALERLNLSFCGMLEALPNLGRLKHLVELDISRCKLIEVVPGFGDLVSLQKFRAHECLKLGELPEMGKLMNLQGLFVPECPSLKAMPGLSDLVALENLVADSGGLEGCHDLRKLSKLARVKVRGWGAEGLPCLSDLVNLKILEIVCAEELTGLENLTRLQELEIVFCDSGDVQCLSNLTALKRLFVSNCKKLERFPDMHRLSRLESLTIGWCRGMRKWESGSGMRLFGAGLHNGGTLSQLRTLCLDVVAFTELPDLSNFPQLLDLQLYCCEEVTRLTSSAPLTALKRLHIYECRRLIALPDVNHLISLTSLKLVGCGELELTVLEIEKLETMCPGLRLDKSHLPKNET